MTDSAAIRRHRLSEDFAALLTGTLLVAFGVMLYTQTQLISGGTAGLALLIHHATGVSFAAAFFAINVPFYWLSWRRLGGMMTGRTILAVAVLSVLTLYTPRWITIAAVDPIYAAVLGGMLMGVGLLILFRHRTSLGGVNLLALHAQENYGLRAGYVQLGIDAAILAAALAVLPPDRAALSFLGALVMNLTLAANHKPGRYVGVSLPRPRTG